MSLDHENMDSFNAAHQRAVEAMSSMFFIPKTFNPNIDEKRAMSHVRERRVSEYQVSGWDSMNDLFIGFEYVNVDREKKTHRLDLIT